MATLDLTSKDIKLEVTEDYVQIRQYFGSEQEDFVQINLIPEDVVCILKHLVVKSG